LEMINYNGSNNSPLFENFYQKSWGAVLIACMGTVPGYFFTVGFIEILGRKFIQYLGFGVLTIVLAVLSLGYDYFLAHPTGFIVLYTIANFFFNFGPNTTTFVIPGEVFPTRFKSFAHGISAAFGKLGAIIGIQLVAPFFKKNAAVVMGVFSMIMLSGLIATAWIPETKGKTLEELNSEYQEPEMKANDLEKIPLVFPPTAH
jgi:PHS family inorganic phosphate transporter-like MFS transporter